jgi:hypothetical protein
VEEVLSVTKQTSLMNVPVEWHPRISWRSSLIVGKDQSLRLQRVRASQ